MKSREFGAGMEIKHVHGVRLSWRWTEKSKKNTKKIFPKGILNLHSERPYCLKSFVGGGMHLLYYLFQCFLS